MFLWSTGFIGAKFGLPYAEPLTFLLVRYLLVMGLMLPVALATKAPWPRDARQWFHIHDPGIRHWLHLPERAAEKEWPTAIPETQTQTKPASPVTSTRIPRIYAPFEGTLLVFDPWYGLVPRDPVARAQLIQELDARRSTEK